VSDGRGYVLMEDVKKADLLLWPRVGWGGLVAEVACSSTPSDHQLNN